MAAAEGPARFFRDHPVLYGLSVSAAAGAAVAMELRSARSRGAAKLGWGLLSLLEWGIVVGLLTLPREAPGGRDA